MTPSMAGALISGKAGKSTVLNEFSDMFVNPISNKRSRLRLPIGFAPPKFFRVYAPVREESISDLKISSGKNKYVIHNLLTVLAGVYVLELAKQHVYSFSFHSSSPLA